MLTSKDFEPGEIQDRIAAVERMLTKLAVPDVLRIIGRWATTEGRGDELIEVGRQVNDILWGHSPETVDTAHD
jgi:hypothetical protein